MINIRRIKIILLILFDITVFKLISGIIFSKIVLTGTENNYNIFLSIQYLLLIITLLISGGYDIFERKRNAFNK